MESTQKAPENLKIQPETPSQKLSLVFVFLLFLSPPQSQRRFPKYGGDGVIITTDVVIEMSVKSAGPPLQEATRAEELSPLNR